MGDVYTQDHVKVVLIYLLSLYKLELIGEPAKDDHFYFGV